MAKNVLIVAGAEGRGYALGWKLSSEGHNVYAAPGNGAYELTGIGQTVDIPVTDFDGLASYAESKGIDLTIVGPEDPLAAGIVDHFQDRELPIFGPSADYARLEASKGYFHDICHDHGIPTPAGQYFMTREAAKRFAQKMWDQEERLFIPKADGLHGGKGVIVAKTIDETIEGIDTLMRKDGDFHDDVLLQEYVDGREVSVTSLVGGGTIVLTGSKDYKAVGSNNFGINPTLNTGGMGVLSPNPFLPDDEMLKIKTTVVDPTIGGVEHDVGKGSYNGVAYSALMLTGNDADPWKVIEHNVRFGAPECEVLMMRMRSDLYPYVEAAVQGRLGQMPPIEWDPRVAMGVVIATPGYPTGGYKQHLGKEFRGIDVVKGMDDAEAFYAGVKRQSDGLVNSGGRVALVTVLADDWTSARKKVYGLIDDGNGVGLGEGADDTQFRADIGLDALE